MKTTKVLIVDDSAPLRYRLSQMLAAVNGLQVVAEASSASEAISLVELFQPEVVVLDIQMPGGSGINVLQEIKRSHPQTKVIMLTNHPEPQYRQRCAQLKADYFLSKSTDARLLIEICEKLAAERNGTQ